MSAPPLKAPCDGSTPMSACGSVEIRSSTAASLVGKPSMMRDPPAPPSSPSVTRRQREPRPFAQAAGHQRQDRSGNRCSGKVAHGVESAQNASDGTT